MQLKDPKKTRKINETPTPYQQSLTMNQLFPNDTVDYKILIKFLKREGKLSKKVYEELIRRTKHILKEQPNLIRLQDPITIVGDIHGQFYDLIKLIDEDTGGAVDKTKYLFLGDYVDRGNFSIECLALVMALKIRFKNTVYLLRGNHQCRQLTSYFNFRTECLVKYDQQLYGQIMELFDQLPLAAIVNNKFLCIHGGISTDIKTIADIEKIQRTREIPKSGLFCDLMWADPVDSDTGKLGNLTKNNSARGCSYFFGYELSKGFLQQNNLLSVIRAHQAQANGFKMYHWGGDKQFPTVITIFSAPNYCDFYNNKGAVIKFKNNTLDIQQYLQNAHPYVLPNFMDALTWSMPFVAQKLTSLLHHLILPGRNLQDKDKIPVALIDRKNVLEKMLIHQKEITAENKDMISYNGRVPDRQLLNNEQVKKYTLPKYKKDFQKKREIDSRNEMRPFEEK